MKKSNHSKYKNYFFCSNCERKRYFEIEGNIKICKVCSEKSSYRFQSRKRWIYGKSHPDTVSLSTSPYNQPCDEGTQNKYDEVFGRFHKLTPREKQVIELLWEGKSETEVAMILGIGRGNVSTYLKRVRVKLQ